MLDIIPLTEDLIDRTNQHLARHVLESGQHGIHWLPYDPSTMARSPSINSDALALGYNEPGWERWHVVVAANKSVVGHIALKGAKFDRGLHRCELMMGLEQPCWRQKLGTRLLKVVVEEASAVEHVEWLDLRVISLNQPAINLYTKHGFKEIARVPDFCRIEGLPVDDILMSINV